MGIESYQGTLALGLVLGVAGASFAVALPLASRWYPPQYQGIALGIAGAGNSGTVFASLFAPGLAALVGWNNVLGLAAIPLTVAFVVYLFAAKDSPTAPPPKKLHEYLAVLRMGDAWWFMFFYAVTFGGFVGLASSLAIFFNTDYGLDAVTAGYFTAACVFCGSFVRPIGGALADRIGGIKTLSLMYALAALALVLVSFRPQSVYVGAGVVCRRHARVRHGQRLGVPARAAAIPPRDRRDDRARRHDGRRRRILPGFEPRHVEATHRQLPGGLAAVRVARGARAGRPDHHQAPLENDLGRRWHSGRPHLIAVSAPGSSHAPRYTRHP